MRIADHYWLVVIGVLAVVGCSSTPSDAPGASSRSGGAPPANLSGELEVAAFKGGYDIDFYAATAKEFEKLHPELKIKVDGNPRVWEQLRPRFVNNTPPDLVFPGWGMDHWGLVAEGQVMALDDALSQKPAEGEGTWRDTFNPRLLELCQQDGKTWMLPLYVMVYGWWHDPNLFKANGWTVPQTWSELLALCEKIKAKGIAPITYQGQYPYYMLDGMLLPWCLSAGGAATVIAAQNLEPGAWKSPAMLKAATMIDELNQKGYLQAGAVGMSHTEAQMQFLLGKAAMVPCGSWLSSEMKEQVAQMNPKPKIEFFVPPVLDDGPGDPTALLIGIEPWMVPTKAKNPQAGIELFRFMTSLSNAKKFVEQKGTLMSIVGSDEGVKMPESLVKPAEAFKGSRTLYAVQFRHWYPEFMKELENALTALVNKEITPQQFCDRVEAKADATRNDKLITKHKVAGSK